MSNYFTVINKEEDLKDLLSQLAITNPVENIEFNINVDLGEFLSRRTTLNITNCRFNKNVLLNNAYNLVNNFTLFINSSFFKELNFNIVSNTSNIIIDETAINRFLLKQTDINDLSIYNSNIDNFYIYSSNFNRVNFIDLESSNEIYIRKNTFNKRLKISVQETSSNKEIKRPENKTINKFIFYNNKISDFRFGHYNIYEFIFGNIKNPSDSEINIGELNINKFGLFNIRNLGKLRMYNINRDIKKNEKEYFQLNDSSLGDSEFQSVNFTSFKENLIYDNLISDLKYTNVDWSLNINIRNKIGYYKKFSNIKKTEEYYKLRDTYRTLKNVADKNNDKLYYSIFFSREMDNYLKYLQSQSNKDYGKIIVLYLLKLINNFGNNWVKNLMIFLLMMLFFSLLFVFYIKGSCSLELIFSNFFKFLLGPFILKSGLENYKENVYMLLFFVIYTFVYGILLWNLIISLKRVVQK